MSFIAAVIGGVAAVGGAAISANAAKSAAGQQYAGTQASIQAQQQALAQATGAVAPYNFAGQSALNQLQFDLGIGGNQFATLPSGQNVNDLADQSEDAYLAANGAAAGSYTSLAAYEAGDPAGAQTDVARRALDIENNAGIGQTPAAGSGYGSLTTPFGPQDLTANLAPNYAFMLGQGQGANENAANAAGGLLGGNALQGLDTFTQNYAQNAYQQAYNNYNTNQSNIYTRLLGLSNQGANAASGQATNAVTTGQGVGAAAAAGGAALAGGTVGAANALSAGANNASSYGLLAQLNANNLGTTQGPFIDPNSGPVAGSSNDTEG